MTFLGQVLGSQGDPAEQPGRSCCFWMCPVGLGNFPGSRDRVPIVTFTYSLLIKTSTMTVYVCHSPHSRLPPPTGLSPQLSLSTASGPLPVLCALPGVAPGPASSHSSFRKALPCWPHVSTAGLVGSASVACVVADTLASLIPSVESGPQLRALLGLLNHPSLCSICSREASQRPARLLTLRPSLVPLV